MLGRQADLCGQWASCQREITRVYFYGSRIWGGHRADSDLDILIVAHPGAVIGSEEEWTTELSRLLSVTVDINDHFTADTELVSRIRSDGLLVFSRYGDDRDFEFEDELEEIDLDDIPMIETADVDGMRILRLAHGKASALDIELVIALRQAIEQAAAERARAVVLTGTGHIFCAGVDLFRVAEGGAAYVRRYLPAFKELMFALFATEIPLVVAANGHAIAGGAVLVAAGDYRLMAEGQGRFGYTELLVGVPFPPAAFEIIRFATPPHRQQDMLYTGATFPPAETFSRGLVDELVEPQRLMARALEVARRIAAIPPAAFAETKRHLRAPTLARMREYEDAYADEVTDLWAADATLASVRAYLAATVRKA